MVPLPNGYEQYRRRTKGGDKLFRVSMKPGIDRQTPRVSVAIRRGVLAKMSLGRSQLKAFRDWNDYRAKTKFNFTFCRQATNKIVVISDAAGALLAEFF